MGDKPEQDAPSAREINDYTQLQHVRWVKVEA